MSQPRAEPTQSLQTPPAPEPRLLDRLREAAQHEGHLPPAIERYADWCRRYILFHRKRHPQDLGAAEVGRFLAHVARTEAHPVDQLEQAHAALFFPYQRVLHRDLGEVPLPQPPRLLDRLRQALWVRHYSRRT